MFVELRRRLWGALAWVIRAPVIIGDGEADDSEALRAWAAGELVRTLDGRGWRRELDGFTFRLREPIVISCCTGRLSMSNCRIETDVLTELERLDTVLN